MLCTVSQGCTQLCRPALCCNCFLQVSSVCPVDKPSGSQTSHNLGFYSWSVLWILWIGQGTNFAFSEKSYQFEILICPNLEWKLLKHFLGNRHSTNHVIWLTKIHSISKKQQFLPRAVEPWIPGGPCIPGSLRQGRGHHTGVDLTEWKTGSWSALQRTIKSYLYSIIRLTEISFHEMFHSQWTSNFWQKTCQKNGVSKRCIHSWMTQW